jgi:Domain of unknown function (DUF1924)
VNQMRIRLLLFVAVVAAAPAWGQSARDAIIAGYLAAAKAAEPGLAGFSAARGEALFRGKPGGGKPDTPSCTTCHGEQATAAGQNVKTSKAIEPMAVSKNPQRYTNAEDVEKWFLRNCKEVLGRVCTPKEKGDFIAYMLTQ